MCGGAAQCVASVNFESGFPLRDVALSCGEPSRDEQRSGAWRRLFHSALSSFERMLRPRAFNVSAIGKREARPEAAISTAWIDFSRARSETTLNTEAMAIAFCLLASRSSSLTA